MLTVTRFSPLNPYLWMGQGGSAKMFLYSVIVSYVHKEGKIAIATALSAEASLLLQSLPLFHFFSIQLMVPHVVYPYRVKAQQASFRMMS